MLVEALSPPTVKLHFADALKYEVAEMVWNCTLPGTNRDEWEAKFLSDKALNGLAFQWWGEWKRQKWSEHYWINHHAFQKRYKDALLSGGNIIISDMRHVNEAEWCRKEGFYLIRVVGPCRAGDERRDPTHASEVHVDELKVDAILDNSRNLDTLKSLALALLYHIERRPHVPFLGS
jgi:hypothetical protein